MTKKTRQLIAELSGVYGIECKVRDDEANHGYELIFQRGRKRYKKKTEKIAFAVMPRKAIEVYIYQCFDEAVKVLGRD